ncbi:hypothetical protein JAAARDRAFT_196705 [Jaapia argillacea MUCL 33604]|uniref:Uncharacterized protein n=1 Tax=Jaapia argillacea MUCL 33604 TaxID=933084 RepID=A0A067PKG5_9AGAM|nr:hypothetical protein JAAARDRAFT_196705 [Jaapia argillacea MUCL 33604]
MDWDQLRGCSNQGGEVQDGITLRVISSTPPPTRRGDALADAYYEPSPHEINRIKYDQFFPLLQPVADAQLLGASWGWGDSPNGAFAWSMDSRVTSERVSIPELPEPASANATAPNDSFTTLAPPTYFATNAFRPPRLFADQLDNKYLVPLIVFPGEVSIGHSLIPPRNATAPSASQHAVAQYSAVYSSLTAFNPPVVADISSLMYDHNPFAPSLTRETSVNVGHPLMPPSYPSSAYLRDPSLDHRGGETGCTQHTDLRRLTISTNVSAGMDAENYRLTGSLPENNETSLDGRTYQPDYFTDPHYPNSDLWQPRSQDVWSDSTSSSSPRLEFPVKRALVARRLSASDVKQRRCGGSGFSSGQMDEGSGSNDAQHRTLRPIRSLEGLSTCSTSNGTRYPFTNESAHVPLSAFSPSSNAEAPTSVEANDGLRPLDSIWTDYRDGGLFPPPASPVYTADTPSDFSYGTALSPMSGTPGSVFDGDEFPAASPSHQSCGQTTQEGEGDYYEGLVDFRQEKQEPGSGREMAATQCEGRNGKRPRSPQATSSVASDAVRGASNKRRRFAPKWSCELCPGTFTRKANLECECAV